MAGNETKNVEKPIETTLSKEDIKFDVLKDYLKDKKFNKDLGNLEKSFLFPDGNVVMIYGNYEDKDQQVVYFVVFNKNNELVDIVEKSINLSDKSYKAKSFEENKIVGKGKTKVINKKVTNSTKEDCRCSVNSKEAVGSDEQQSVQSSGSCPPGYMWELYNCRTETGIEWGEYFACMALVKKHSTCIALASYTEEICDGECVPIA